MKTVTLSQSYMTHEGSSDKVSFREPVFNDVMEFGEPIAKGLMADGVYIHNVNYEAVRSYAERLVQSPWNAALLGQLNVKDSFRVVDAIRSFFEQPAPSASEQTTSSSPSDGTPAASAN